MPSFCAQCGAALAADAKFCEECGAPLGGAAFKLAPSFAQGLRRRVWLWLVAGGGAVLLIVGGMFFVLTDWFNPDARANKLFVEASRLLQSAQEAETASYTEAFKLYQAALAKVEKITTQYPSSQLAVQLTQGTAKIGPYTITEFQETVRKAEVRAKAEESPLACALFVAGTIEDVSFRASVLTGIAGKYAEAGEKEKALEVLSQALKTVEKADEKSWALRGIAGKYAEVGQYNQALQVTKTIEKADEKAWALTEIADKYAEAGQKNKASELLSQALQVAATMEDADKKAWVLAMIAKKYAEAEQYDQAFHIANQLAKMGKHGHSYRGSVFVDIARQYAQVGQYDQALQVAGAIEDAGYKTGALAEIAGAYTQAGQHDRALQITKTMENTSSKARALTKIAGACAEAGQERKALEILSLALRAAEMMEEHSQTRAIRLSEIAGKYVQVGEREKASEIFSRALQVAKTIEGVGLRNGALTSIASGYMEAGQYDQALQVAQMAGDASRMSVTIAGKYAEAGQYDQALRVAKTIENADIRSQALVQIAGKYAKIGEKVDDNARKILHEIIRLAGAPSSITERAGGEPLPDHYGVFAVVDGAIVELYRLTGEAQGQFAYNSTLSVSPPNTFSDRRVYFLNYSLSGPQGYELWAAGPEGRFSRRVSIELLISPVEAKPNMYKIKPRQPLQSGIYILSFIGCSDNGADFRCYCPIQIR